MRLGDDVPLPVLLPLEEVEGDAVSVPDAVLVPLTDSDAVVLGVSVDDIVEDRLDCGVALALWLVVFVAELVGVGVEVGGVARGVKDALLDWVDDGVAWVDTEAVAEDDGDKDESADRCGVALAL